MMAQFRTIFQKVLRKKSGISSRLQSLQDSLQYIRCYFLILICKHENRPEKCNDGCQSLLLQEPREMKAKEAFDRHGSDKGRGSGIYRIYSLLDGEKYHGSMLEIGIGSHDPEIPSNMVGIGSSGGSIRAFLELFPYWEIWAADIDPKCFFSSPSLVCNEVNQKKLRSLKKLAHRAPKSLSLVVIDGLHKFYADFNSLFCLRGNMRCGSVFVVEDIFDAELDYWNRVIVALSRDFVIGFRKRPGGNALILLKTCNRARNIRHDELQRLQNA